MARRGLLALGGGAWLFGIANPVLYMIVLALITGFVLRWMKFGRYLFAIGGNEHAATLTGVPVKQIKVAVYMISALSAGIAGIIQTIIPIIACCWLEASEETNSETPRSSAIPSTAGTWSR